MYLSLSTIKSSLFLVSQYKDIFYWITYYIISDLIQMTMLIGSFFVCKKALYSYAKFKFLVTTILLILNLAMIVYGITIVISLPTQFAD